jgi:hypothetical protein
VQRILFEKDTSRIMTENLKTAFMKLAMSTYSTTPSVLSDWVELTLDEAMDFKAQVTVLVMDADIQNERGKTTTRMIIRRPLAGMTKLAPFAPWNELFVIGPTGGVSLNAKLTNEEITELWRMLAPYQSAIAY